MVFIPIELQYASLIITIITTIAELAALSALILIIRLCETQTLGRGKQVLLYRHCQRKKLIAIAVMLSFVTLETIASVYSEHATRDRAITKPCASMLRIDKQDNNTRSSERDAEIISFNCLKAEGEMFVQYKGNISLNSKTVICGKDQKDRLYEYRTSTPVTRLVSRALLRCKNNGKIPACIYYEYVGDQLFISKGMRLSPERSKKEIEFLSTKLYFNISRSLPKIINRVLYIRSEAFSDASNEELHFRRRIFSDVVLTKCKFKQDGKQIKGTEIPFSVLIIIISVWLTLFITFIVLLVATQRRYLIDLSDPFYWTEANCEPDLFSRRTVRIELVQPADGSIIVSESAPVVKYHFPENKEV